MHFWYHRRILIKKEPWNFLRNAFVVDVNYDYFILFFICIWIKYKSKNIKKENTLYIVERNNRNSVVNIL